MADQSNPMLAFNRPQWSITPAPPTELEPQNLPYDDYGILPNVAQDAQNASYVNNPTPPSYFNQVQLAAANWFTTRVHLAPLGKAE